MPDAEEKMTPVPKRGTVGPVSPAQEMRDIIASVYEDTAPDIRSSRIRGRALAQGIQAQLNDALRQQQVRANQELTQARVATGAVPEPSRLRYTIGMFLAAVLDLVDILTTLGAITGVVWLAGVAIDTVFGVLLMKWVSQGYAKAEDVQRNSIQTRTQLIDQRIASYRSRAARGIPAGRRAPQIRRPIKQFSKKTPGAARGFSPLRRITSSIVVDCIPVAELLPMKLLLVRSLRKDHERAFRECRNRLQEFVLAQEGEFEEFSLQQEAAVVEVIRGIPETLTA